MRPTELLTSLRRAGCHVSVRGDRLRVSGPGDVQLTADLRSALIEHKRQLLHLLAADDAEVRWRVEAMRPRVPASGVIPPMYARHLSRIPADCCLSCGEPLTPGNKYHCEPCVRAAWQVLRDVRGDDGATRPLHRRPDL
jgi:hypothetical protein